MSNLTDREREDKLSILSDLIRAMHVQYRRGTSLPVVSESVIRWTAELTMEKLEACELSFDRLREEANVQSHEVTKECPF